MLVILYFFPTNRGGEADAWWKIPLFFCPSLGASSIFRFQVMWFVQFACVFLLLILLCNLPFCLLPLHFSILVDFAKNRYCACPNPRCAPISACYSCYHCKKLVWSLMTGCTLIPATRDSTLRQRDRANCAVYQFDRSVRDQKLIMRDLDKYGDQYHYSLQQ